MWSRSAQSRMGLAGPAALPGSTRAQTSVPSTMKYTMVSMPIGSTTSSVTANSQRCVAVAAARLGDVLRPQPEDQVLAGREAVARRVRRPAPAADQLSDSAPAAPAPSCSSRQRQEVHRRRADEAGDEPVLRVVVELLRRADLLDAAVVHHHHAVGQRHRLDLVVGDVDRGGAGPSGARCLISVRICTRSLASRFDSGSSNRNTFGLRTMARPMATRWRWPPDSCLRLAVEQLGDVEDARGLLDALLDLGLRELPQLAARTPCSRTPSCADRARSSGTPWRCRGPSAARR